VYKREVLDQLSERLSDLAEFAAADNNGDGADDDTSDGEDILADIIATPSESLDSSRSPEMSPAELHEPSEQTPDPLEPPSPQFRAEKKDATPQPNQPTTTSTSPSHPTTTTTTSQTLRPRHPNPTTPSHHPPADNSKENEKATTTSTLFGDRPTTTTTALTTEEAILDHQRATQDALSESILKLASELKASSHAFSASLEQDKEVVDRAGQGMGKTGQTMEGVTRRMGMLTRMTEGEGWWGRVRLYVIVYGLMVVLVLVVGVLPKLRF
jgi:hypothetical protein